MEVHLVILDRLLRATTKKRSSTFLRKKVHPPDKILATPMPIRKNRLYLPASMKAKAPKSGFARKKTQAAHKTYPVMSGGAFSCSSRCCRSPSTGFPVSKFTATGRSAAKDCGLAAWSKHTALSNTAKARLLSVHFTSTAGPPVSGTRRL